MSSLQALAEAFGGQLSAAGITQGGLQDGASLSSLLSTQLLLVSFQFLSRGKEGERGEWAWVKCGSKRSVAVAGRATVASHL